MDADLNKRYRFMREWAGYIVGERARSALELARAEQRFEQLQDEDRASVAWPYDDQPYDPGDICNDDEARAKFESNEWTGPYGCVVTIDDEARSLWGIVFGPQDLNDPYARVVVAELADELLHDLEREQTERERAARQDIATVEA